MGQGLLSAVAIAAAATAACSGATGDEAASPQRVPLVGGEQPVAKGPGDRCERNLPGKGPTREGASRQGSSVALAREGKSLLAYVADRDAHRLSLVDVKTSKTITQATTLGSPEQVLVLGDGRVVVSLPDAGFVDVYEPVVEAEAHRLDHLCRVPVPAGPFGLAAATDEGSVVVTSAFDPALTVLDGSSLRPTKAFALARSPRGVLVDETGRAFVTHLNAARLSVVDLTAPADRPATRKVDLRVRAGSQIAEQKNLAVLREGSQAYALASVELARPSASNGASTEGGPALQGGAPSPKAPPQPQPKVPPRSKRIVVPMVSVDPGDDSRPTQFYYGPPPVAGVPKQAPITVIVDPAAEKSLVSHVLAPTAKLRREECLLPRAVAFRASTERLYVACLGIDAVFELDARAADPMRAVMRRFDVPQFPTGIAIADTEGIALVAAQELGQIARIDLDSGAVAFVNLERPSDSFSTEFLLGRQLFHRTDDPRMTADGIACASCHPEGGDDGHTWATPEGPRQTLMLAGRVTGSEPYGWSRGKPNLHEYITDTMSRLGGGSLDRNDVEALAFYVKSLKAPPRANIEVSLAEKGRAAFEARGCKSCHIDAPQDSGLTESFASVMRASAHDTEAQPDFAPILPKPKDVGSKTENDDVGAFDTPSLFGVRLTAPYYHDGRYDTLDALLADPKSSMGEVSRLSVEERAAIKSYLESL